MDSLKKRYEEAQAIFKAEGQEEVATVVFRPRRLGADYEHTPAPQELRKAVRAEKRQKRKSAAPEKSEEGKASAVGGKKRKAPLEKYLQKKADG